MQQLSNSTKQRPWSLKRILICILSGMTGGIVIAFIGLVVGATYGGNYATGFQFGGQQGYEATGIMGAVIGFVGGGFLSVYLVDRLTNHCSGSAGGGPLNLAVR